MLSPPLARNARYLTGQWALLLVLCMKLLASGSYAQEPDVAASNPFAPAIEYAQQRCVKIYGASIGREPGYSTGIIVSPQGDILTSSGVYLFGNQIRVVMPDGTLHQARVSRRSNALQTALLKIDADTPMFFDLSTAQTASQGDWVIGVSNLFKVAEGSEPLSANLGIIGLRTRVDAKRGTQNVPYDGELLLIDAITSTPGASGGAVVDLNGTLIGMIGKSMESSSTNTRINYVVPADRLSAFLKEQETPLVVTSTPTKTAKPYTGVRLFSLSGRRAPAYIDQLANGSPAALAGLQKDDLILSIDGTSVRNVGEYTQHERQLVVGKSVAITVKRQEEVLSYTFVVAEEP